jgi:hypothetical protein
VVARIAGRHVSGEGVGGLDDACAGNLLCHDLARREAIEGHGFETGRSTAFVASMNTWPFQDTPATASVTLIHGTASATIEH